MDYITDVKIFKSRKVQIKIDVSLDKKETKDVIVLVSDRDWDIFNKTITLSSDNAKIVMIRRKKNENFRTESAIVSIKNETVKTIVATVLYMKNSSGWTPFYKIKLPIKLKKTLKNIKCAKIPVYFLTFIFYFWKIISDSICMIFLLFFGGVIDVMELWFFSTKNKDTKLFFDILEKERKQTKLNFDLVAKKINEVILDGKTTKNGLEKTKKVLKKIKNGLEKTKKDLEKTKKGLEKLEHRERIRTQIGIVCELGSQLESAIMMEVTRGTNKNIYKIKHVLSSVSLIRENYEKICKKYNFDYEKYSRVFEILKYKRLPLAHFGDEKVHGKLIKNYAKEVLPKFQTQIIEMVNILKHIRKDQKEKDFYIYSFK